MSLKYASYGGFRFCYHIPDVWPATAHRVWQVNWHKIWTTFLMFLFLLAVLILL